LSFCVLACSHLSSYTRLSTLAFFACLCGLVSDEGEGPRALTRWHAWSAPFVLTCSYGAFLPWTPCATASAVPSLPRRLPTADQYVRRGLQALVWRSACTLMVLYSVAARAPASYFCLLVVWRSPLWATGREWCGTCRAESRGCIMVHECTSNRTRNATIACQYCVVLLFLRSQE